MTHLPAAAANLLCRDSGNWNTAMDSVRWGANYLLDCRIGDEQYVAQVSEGQQRPAFILERPGRRMKSVSINECSVYLVKVIMSEGGHLLSVKVSVKGACSLHPVPGTIRCAQPTSGRQRDCGAQRLDAARGYQLPAPHVLCGPHHARHRPAGLGGRRHGRSSRWATLRDGIRPWVGLPH